MATEEIEPQFEVVVDDRLEARIEEAELDGWTLVERKKHTALLQRPAKQSLLVHLILHPTFGFGNLLYRRHKKRNPHTMMLGGRAHDEIQKELREEYHLQAKERQKAKEEAGKNVREGAKVFRKFF